ncbi:hypothetical protein FRC12_007390 [Ceratobasidium sp. 428]|nr:hypothetical protein FRC12_007390 [Ceratobasidium sp. 428]
MNWMTVNKPQPPLMLFASRMLLRVPGRAQALYLNPHLRAFSITRIALEPPKKAVPPPPPAPAPKRATKKAPVEPEKPAPKRRLLLSDKERAQADKEKEKERKAKEREREKVRAAKEKERVRAVAAREKARVSKQREKEREKLRKEREKARELKKAEKPYPKPPKRPLTGYMLFSTERNRHTGLNITQAAAETSEAWKALADSEKQGYAKRYESARVKYDSDLAQWVASLNHAQLAIARSNREPGTRGEAALLQLPKRPGNAYALFYKDAMNRQDIADKVEAAARKESGGDPTKAGKLKVGLRGRFTAEEWNALSDKDKQVYAAKAAELKKVWDKNYGATIAQEKEAQQSATV